MRSRVAEGIHCGTIESLRSPKVFRNSAWVSVTPSTAMVSRQAIQWYCSESTRVPSRSQRTDLGSFRGWVVVAEKAIRHIIVAWIVDCQIECFEVPLHYFHIRDFDESAVSIEHSVACFERAYPHPTFR